MGMVARRTLTISIIAEQDSLVRACLRSGRYATASEVVRAALRLLERVEGDSLGHAVGADLRSGAKGKTRDRV